MNGTPDRRAKFNPGGHMTTNLAKKRVRKEKRAEAKNRRAEKRLEARNLRAEERRKARSKRAIWMRDHRRWFRTLNSGLAALASVFLLLIAFSWWTKLLPPSDLMITTSTTLAEPVLTVDPVGTAIGGAVAVIVLALGICGRRALTDTRLDGELRRHGTDVFIDSVLRVHPLGHTDSGRAEDTASREARGTSLARSASSLLGTLANAAAPKPDGSKPTPEASAPDVSDSGSGKPELAEGVPSPTPLQRSSPDGVEGSSGEEVGLVLAMLLQALVAPHTVFSRVSERVSLQDERAGISLTRAVDGSAALASLKLIPVLTLKRGGLLGGLNVTVDGTASQTLPVSTSRGVMIEILRDLVQEAENLVPQPGLVDLFNLQNDIANHLVSDAPVTDDEQAVLLSRFDKILAGHHLVKGMQWFRSFIRMCLGHDVVLVPLPDGCAKARRIVVEFDEPYGVPVEGPTALAKRLLGIGQQELKIVLFRVADAKTFHLDVTASDETYIEQAEVILPRNHANALH